MPLSLKAQEEVEIEFNIPPSPNPRRMVVKPYRAKGGHMALWIDAPRDIEIVRENAVKRSPRQKGAA